MWRTLLTALFLIALTASVAQADEEIFWTMDNPPLNEDIPVDLGASGEFLLRVHVTVAGYGGGLVGTCDDGGGQYDQDLNNMFTVHLNSRTWEVVAPLYTSFEYGNYTYFGGEDLEPDQFTLHFEYTAPSFDTYMNCYLVGEDPFEMHSVSLIVTCDSVVPTDRASWSAIKALYR